jgi:hypothetical protein
MFCLVFRLACAASAMRAVRGRAFVLCVLAVGWLVALPSDPASAKSGAAVVVPVLAEVDGSFPSGRLVDASVRVYDFAVCRHRAAFTGAVRTRLRLIGVGKTGTRGVDLVPLRIGTVPGKLEVVVSGGRLAGRPFRGTLRAQALDSSVHAVFVTPPSTLAALDQARHPGRSLAYSDALANRAFGLVAKVDAGFAMFDTTQFIGPRLLRAAAAHGGFDRYLSALAARLGRGGKASVAAVAIQAPSVWKCNAGSTAGFARFLGITGTPPVPSTVPSCTASAASDSAGDPTAHPAASTRVVYAFRAVTGLATAGYKIFTAVQKKQTVSADTAAIQAAYLEMESQLTTIEQQLSALTTSVTNISGEVESGNIALLSADADPIITDIQTTTKDTIAMAGAGDQLITCAKANPLATSTSTAGSYSNTAACSGTPTGNFNFNTKLTPAVTIGNTCPKGATYVNTYLGNGCKTFNAALSNLENEVANEKQVANGIKNLAKYAIGAAAAGSGAGIVQLALEAPSSQPFFQTSNAADARLEWAYYTLYAAHAQSLETTLLFLSNSVKGRSLGNIATDVNNNNNTIQQLLGAYPNMPDTATINLYDGAMWSQTLAGLASWNLYQSSPYWQLSTPTAGQSVIWGSTYGPGHGAMFGENSISSAPVTMAPLGNQWTFFTQTTNPANGAITSNLSAQPPAMVTSTYQNWQVGQSPAQSNLYASAQPSGGETAGQWMTGASGILPALITPNETGYSSAYGGTFMYSNTTCIPGSGAACSNTSTTGMQIGACTPGYDSDCLLPTWQSTTSGPAQGVTAMFDMNDGAAIGAQSGEINCDQPIGNGGFANTWGNGANWTTSYAQTHGPNQGATIYPQLPFFQGNLTATQGPASVWPNNYTTPTAIAACSGGTTSSLSYSTLAPGNANYSPNGVPVLFYRAQQPGDCFYFDGSGTAATSPSCLTPRTTSSQVLPNLTTPFGTGAGGVPPASNTS